MEAKTKAPSLLVAAVVANSEGLVLLSRHSPHWKWHLPDGEVRLGYGLEETLRSSFFDDFGMQLRLLDKQTWLVTETIAAARQLHLVTHHFRAETVSNIADIKEREGLHVMWGDPVAVKDMSPEHMLQSTSQALRKAAKSQWRP